MRDPLNVFAHRAFKKHDVARLHLVLRNTGAQAVQPLGPQPSGVVHAAVGEHIAHKSRTVKAGFRACPAPDIGIADILAGFLHECGEGRICIQRLLRDVVERRIAQRHRIGIAGENALHVAVGGHVQRIHAHGMVVHADHGQMGEVLVFQPDFTDGVRIRHLYVIGICLGSMLAGFGVCYDLRAGSRLRSVPGFC